MIWFKLVSFILLFLSATAHPAPMFKALSGLRKSKPKYDLAEAAKHARCDEKWLQVGPTKMKQLIYTFGQPPRDLPAILLAIDKAVTLIKDKEGGCISDGDPMHPGETATSFKYLRFTQLGVVFKPRIQGVDSQERSKEKCINDQVAAAMEAIANPAGDQKVNVEVDCTETPPRPPTQQKDTPHDKHESNSQLFTITEEPDKELD